MKFSTAAVLLTVGLAAAKPLANPEPAAQDLFPRGISPLARDTKHLRFKRASTSDGQPIRASDGAGAPLLGGTNKAVDLQNPDGLGAQATDNGVVPNLVWSFSNSRSRLLKGGFVRESVITDLPSSHDIAAAQQHLKKGASRELHWHKTAEWGIVYAGSVAISAVDENGQNTYDVLQKGDIWYFPKGVGHVIQGLQDENEYLLVFDDSNFDAVGQTFNAPEWLSRTPVDILAKNFGVNTSVFTNIPKADPYIVPINVTNGQVTYPYGKLQGQSSYIYSLNKNPPKPVPGGGGTLAVIDSRNFPISKTIAATYVTLKPKGLRELHWHPNAEEWLYFHQGQARATVYIGSNNARTFDLKAGDTAVFPDNSGHYIENTSDTEDLIWLEFYKSDRVADISLTQWLALTPADIVAQTFNISLAVVNQLKKEKQFLLK